jgi:4-amino-4-deoxychorismate lyase
MNRTRKEMLGLTEPLHIADLLKAVSLPMECSKLRFVYDKEGIHDITCTPYIRKEINSLHLVYDNNISYPYKSTDRSALNELKKQQGDCDEILIVRDNHLTDTSYTNIALYDGEQWFTPSTPLLCGTMRQRLLDCGLLQEREIMVSDIPDYQYISLFNAMISLGEVILPVDKIK